MLKESYPVASPRAFSILLRFLSKKLNTGSLKRIFSGLFSPKGDEIPCWNPNLWCGGTTVVKHLRSECIFCEAEQRRKRRLREEEGEGAGAWVAVNNKKRVSFLLTRTPLLTQIQSQRSFFTPQKPFQKPKSKWSTAHLEVTCCCFTSCNNIWLQSMLQPSRFAEVAHVVQSHYFFPSNTSVWLIWSPV